MNAKGFFEVLFDFSFSEFVTVRIIKILYILGIIGSGIWGLVILGGAFSQGLGGAVLGLILAPIVFCLGVLGARVYLEIVIVMFRIAENTSILVAQGKVESEEKPQV